MINTRKIASELLQSTYECKDFEESCNKSKNFNELDQRDKNFIRLTILETLRRNGQVNAIIDSFLKKPINLNRVFVLNLLRISVCQILYLKVSEYAVVNSSVEAAKKYNLQKFVNGVLRNICRSKKRLLEEFKDTSNLPSWIADHLMKSLDNKDIFDICAVIKKEPGLALKIKDDFLKKRKWETIFNGVFCEKDIIYTQNKGKIPNLPYYLDGFWWVQGISASLPVKCLKKLYKSSALKKVKILEVGAAPGGKTAQLIDYGFQTTSIEISKQRTKKLTENLSRLNFKSNIICGDFLKLRPNEKYDSVLIDAPCTASGLIQKKPEILISDKYKNLDELILKQQQILHHAKCFVKKGGYIVYCVCSIITTEGELQINRFLKENKGFSLVCPDNDIAKYGKLVKENMLMILPKKIESKNNIDIFLDGFFIAILKKE